MQPDRLRVWSQAVCGCQVCVISFFLFFSFSFFLAFGLPPSGPERPDRRSIRELAVNGSESGVHSHRRRRHRACAEPATVLGRYIHINCSPCPDALRTQRAYHTCPDERRCADIAGAQRPTHSSTATQRRREIAADRCSPIPICARERNPPPRGRRFGHALCGAPGPQPGCLQMRRMHGGDGVVGLRLCWESAGTHETTSRHAKRHFGGVRSNAHGGAQSRRRGLETCVHACSALSLPFPPLFPSASP